MDFLSGLTTPISRFSRSLSLWGRPATESKQEPELKPEPEPSKRKRTQTRKTRDDRDTEAHKRRQEADAEEAAAQKRRQQAEAEEAAAQKRRQQAEAEAEEAAARNRRDAEAAQKEENRLWVELHTPVRNEPTVLSDITKVILDAMGYNPIHDPNSKVLKVVAHALSTYVSPVAIVRLRKMNYKYYHRNIREVAKFIRLKALSFILNSSTDDDIAGEYNGYNELNLHAPVRRCVFHSAGPNQVAFLMDSRIHNQIMCRVPSASVPQAPIQMDTDVYQLFPTFMLGKNELVYSIGPVVHDLTSQVIGRPLVMVRVYNYKVK